MLSHSGFWSFFNNFELSDTKSMHLRNVITEKSLMWWRNDFEPNKRKEPKQLLALLLLGIYIYKAF